MDDSAIAVFTGKSVEEILQSGGSGSWLLNPRNARLRKYLVCARNDRLKVAGPEEAHGAAFLVGHISGLVQLEAEKGVPRWRIALSDYASIHCPGVWANWRNPVRYTTLSALGIRIDDLTFQAMPEQPGAPTGETGEARQSALNKLTIAAAKEGLAAMFGVSPEAIEIIIRG